jgi:hypothetical protein
MLSSNGTDTSVPFTLTLARIGKPAVATVDKPSVILNLITDPFTKVGVVLNVSV